MINNLMFLMCVRVLKRVIGVFVISLTLSSCIEMNFLRVKAPKPEVIMEKVIQPESELQPEPKPEPVVHSEEQMRQIKLRELLVQGLEALSRDRLMTPRPGSAFDSYQKVLAIDESNKEGRLGMERITSRYMELAETAFIAGNTRRAQLMLDRALTVSAKKEDVEAMRAHYAKRQIDIIADEFQLSASDLSDRNDNSIAELDKLAKKARDNGSRLLIIARNDREGRWIYQQMRLAVNGFRLRGNIKIGRTPAVVLIDAGA